MADFTEEAGFITRSTTGMFALERDRQVLENKIAAALQGAYESGRQESAPVTIPASASPTYVPDRDIVYYVAKYGGRCNDCELTNGICRNSGLPCSGTQGIEHVINALRYGIRKGFISNPFAGPAPIPAGWKLVPIEPTLEMLKAGAPHTEGDSSLPYSLYSAMLAKAPDAGQ